MKRAIVIFCGCLIVFSVIIADQPVCACSRSFPRHHVLGDFAATVMDPHGRPVEGVEVTIVRFVTKPEGSFKRVVSEEVASHLTDKNGSTVFRGLPDGRYFIATRHARVEGGASELGIGDSGDAVLTLVWPAVPIIKLQRLSGNLKKMGKGNAALANAEVSLTEAYSEESVGKASTDQQGRFSFEDAKPGLYVMHIEEGRECDRYMCEIRGNMVVEVDPNAQNAELPPFGLIITSCGLGAHKEDGSMMPLE